MRRLFHRPKSTVDNNLPDRSLATASPSKQILPHGIKALHLPVNGVIDIVFVHGITGDRERTWTAQYSSEPWPKILLPSKFPTARMLTFGYGSFVADWRGMVSQNKIEGHARNLLSSLALYRENDDTNGRPIIFVCHGLGGLVCENALVISRQLRERHLQSIFRSTCGIILLGTPHQGDGLTEWAKALSTLIGVKRQTNDAMLDILRRDSEVLARIQDNFCTMITEGNKEGFRPIEVICLFEELPLPGIGIVVAKRSATLPGHASIGIHSNHMNMTKFSSSDDSGFVAICNALGQSITRMDNPDKHLETPGRSLANTSYFLVPYRRNPDFVGRSDILQLLKHHSQHNQLEVAHNSQRRICMYGLGGMGKTQIALEYSYRLREIRPEVAIYWVHAHNAERFRRAYDSIARECHIPGYDDPKADILRLVKSWLERKGQGRWVMVVDNADNTELFRSSDGSIIDGRDNNLSSYIPECTHGSILITTRNKELGTSLCKGQTVVEVNNMDEGDTCALIRANVGHEVTADELLALASRLHQLPLALVQASAFIRESAVSISDYLQLLTQGFQIISRDLEPLPELATELTISIRHIQQQNSLASDLLSLTSFFDWQAIPIKFLSHYSERRTRVDEQRPPGVQSTRQTAFEKALTILKAFSIVSEAAYESVVTHPLIQLATRKWLADKGKARQFAGEALLTISELFPFSNFENRPTCSDYLPHVNAVLKYETMGSRAENIARASLLHRTAGFFLYLGRWKDAEILQRQAADLRIAEFGEEHPSTLASLTNLAIVYRNQGRLEEAEELEVLLLERRKNIQGEEHPDTLASMTNLASTYKSNGRWAMAQKLEMQVMMLSSRIMGEEHPDTLNSMSSLASTYRNQGQWVRAEELEDNMVKIFERILGAEHPSTLVTMSNLASTLSNQGLWKQAEKLEVQVLEVHKKVLGPDHPDTLTSMANLASTYWKQGRWVAAEELEVQVLEARKRVLGVEHPSTLIGMANLASTFRNQGQWDQAEDLEMQVLEARRRILGLEHPDTLTSVANLASTYRDQGRWDEAEKLDVQVMETSKLILGPDHPNTLTSVNNLASTFMNQGRWTEAEDLFVEVMETSKRVLGHTHPDTLTSMANLASTYLNGGRWKEAEDLFVEVLAVRQRVLGSEHPSTLTSMAILASTLGKQGRLDEAASMLREVLEKRRRILGDEHPDTISAMNGLAIMLRDQGKLDEAASMFREVLEKRRRVLGDEHPDTISTINSLAIMLGDQGKLDEAASMFREVLEKRRRILGDEHPDTISAMNGLAIMLRDQGKLDEAASMFREVLEKRQQILGDEHPDTILVMSNLAIMLGDQGKLDEADSLSREVLEKRQRILGDEHPLTLNSMANLASAVWNRGRWSEAEELNVKVMETRKRVLGAKHPATLSSMANLAWILKSQGKDNEAQHLMSLCVSMLLEKLGAAHPSTVAAVRSLEAWRTEV